MNQNKMSIPIPCISSFSTVISFSMTFFITILLYPSYPSDFSRYFAMILDDNNWHCTFESDIDLTITPSCSLNYLKFSPSTIFNSSYNASFFIFHTFDPSRFPRGSGSLFTYNFEGSKSELINYRTCRILIDHDFRCVADGLFVELSLVNRKRQIVHLFLAQYF